MVCMQHITQKDVKCAILIDVNLNKSLHYKAMFLMIFSAILSDLCTILNHCMKHFEAEKSTTDLCE